VFPQPRRANNLFQVIRPTILRRDFAEKLRSYKSPHADARPVGADLVRDPAARPVLSVCWLPRLRRDFTEKLRSYKSPTPKPNL
jgi:hypothetical protein